MPRQRARRETPLHVKLERGLMVVFAAVVLRAAYIFWSTP